MKTLLLVLALTATVVEVQAQNGVRRGRAPRTTTDTVRYSDIAPDSSATDRGSGFGSTPGLSPRTERSDPARQAEQKSNATDPSNQTYERRQR